MIAGGLKEGIKENFIQIANNINGLKVFLAEEAAQSPCDLLPEGDRRRGYVLESITASII